MAAHGVYIITFSCWHPYCEVYWWHLHIKFVSDWQSMVSVYDCFIAEHAQPTLQQTAWAAVNVLLITAVALAVTLLMLPAGQLTLKHVSVVNSCAQGTAGGQQRG